MTRLKKDPIALVLISPKALTLISEVLWSRESIVKLANGLIFPTNPLKKMELSAASRESDRLPLIVLLKLIVLPLVAIATLLARVTGLSKVRLPTVKTSALRIVLPELNMSREANGSTLVPIAPKLTFPLPATMTSD